jgi:hypothetical protein
MRTVIPAVLVVVATAFAGSVRPSTQPRQGAGEVRPSTASGQAEGVTTGSADAARSPRNANYTIAVRLDTATHTLHGRETISWRNISRASTSELRFHLYYNAWRNTASTFYRDAALAGGRYPAPREQDAGWTDVTAIRLVAVNAAPVDLAPGKRFIALDDGNGDDRTVMSVSLPREVAPGDTAVVELEWTARVPRTVARTGVVGNFYFLAQWFPKIGVLEDEGWNCHQFHASTEFFADYGVYDVSMTVPRGWVVGASGREREFRDEAGGATTWRFRADDVHDFAWTTSPDYVERRERFQAPGLPAVEMRLLLQPEHVSQAGRHFRATRAALRYYGQWFGAYPYPNITIVDPAWQSGAGGMEYPTLFTAGTRWLAPEGVTSPEGVTVHECGHQFWYALVGNNEFENAWLDEGLNTYSTARVIEQEYRDENHLSRRFFGGFVPFVFRDIAQDRVDGDGISSYRQAARIDVPSTPSWRYWPAAGGPLSYSKTALWLHTLENHLGWPTFRKCLATYFERWKFRHPKPADFFQVVNQVSGRDLTWFFDQVYRDTRVFDYAIDSLRSVAAPAGDTAQGGGKARRGDDTWRGASALRTTVIVRRNGDGIFPVDILVRFADGHSVREHWDGRDPWKAFTWDRAVPAVSAEVDPERVLVLDVNRTNNSRLAQPAASQAATKWMVTWMVWLQDLLVSYAGVV